MVHGDFPEQLSLFKLCLEQILLVSHPGAVACLGCLVNLLKQLSVALKDSQRSGEIAELEVCRFDSGADGAAYGLVPLLQDISFTFRDLPSEAQFPWVGKILGDAQTDVGETADRVSGKVPRASNAYLLHHE